MTEHRRRADRSAVEPVTERRIYPAAERNATRMGRRAKARDRRAAPGAGGAGRRTRRSPLLAVAVLIVIALIVVLTGVAARDGGLRGPQEDTGSFRLLPLTTTTTT